jgi:hypothetical protein
MNFINRFDENCVKNIAVSKHTGADKQNAIMVTYKEPQIKGKNPNSFSCGNQIPELISSQNDFNSNNGLAFRYKPIPIIMGSARMIEIDIIIHEVESLLIIILLYNMLLLSL